MSTKFITGNNVTFSNDNRIVSVKPNANAKCNNPKTKGAWYFEFDILKKRVGMLIGMGDSNQRMIYCGSLSYSFGYHINDARFYYNGSTCNIGSKYNEGDNIGVGIDIDNKKVTYYKNGIKNFEYNLREVPKELYIEVGTGGDADTTVSLLTSTSEMKYYKKVRDIYKPYDMDKYLIKENSRYYTIKSDFYNNQKFQPITLLDGENLLTKADYEIYGFDDIDILLNSMEIDNETFTPLDKFGKEFNIRMWKYK